ncbi:putative primosomal protein N' OS=Tsukamurella paurometabola (strain ATCC 8368 / DSM / CCUG 35730 / CIP 100753 / JCM 10117 / KCTC 9821 / NBRC 16120 / NCIMB 702349 / NCTC 13040) OX=521096 GN=priA PE=3 SV=1 [Tsukamurella paurometabola]|uniref:Probable replication restart protein PriA n=1 Tax=Tsukamurella paurometabola (strain ATCC 8368 / DSM 20162 / CCUG 35730 / CIP 100753 / JCM 10117 / KCTC 9821 / NBRC 16120 / NCIMB 702349 / NCTC 13040) TaxID=521096 RepID=D5URX2_TSUPD|nr:primosomal protein N' [Tsukamurella paurometabola]ADG79177.1 primosomal protein N' [Tsukamurella paurometabola DSM 20162]SUP34409.1 Primosomal protein N' [Tsukamurella paurometabola]
MDAAPTPVELPIARVLPLLQVSHLDREFDYLVPPEFDADAQPGVRVRVRFSGRLVDGYLLERLPRSDHDGKLARLDRVVSPLPVLTPPVLRLVTEVATRYAGTRADVLRLAIPPRHARVEKDLLKAEPPAPPEPPEVVAALAEYTHGEQFVAAALAGRAPHAVWQALPGEDWAARLAELAAAVIESGRSALLVVPDQADLDRLAAACADLKPTVLAAGLGPSARYRRWLTALLGRTSLVIGTRSAAFVPLANPGLLVLWDDGDESFVEPRAPYPHTREVLALRAHQEGAALVIGGFARTPEAQALLDAGWAAEVTAPRERVRERSPRIIGVADSDFELARDPLARSARLPAAAFAAARAALDAERPVLVQVPRRGYAPAMSCERCRTPARCRRCHGPLEQAAGGVLRCRWCDRPDAGYRCPACGGTTMRAVIVGASRTAEELGRAFPGAAVTMSGGEHVLAEVPGGRRLVVATPGAEPVVEHGYGAALLLDGWLLLGRADLRAGEETVRRWMNAAALVAADGTVVCGADASIPAVQALIRWDAAGFAASELAERAVVGFPPAAHLAALDGAESDVVAVAETAELPPGAEILGPVGLPPGVRVPGAPDEGSPPMRVLIRVPRRDGRALAQAVFRAQVGRSLRREGSPVRIQMDPLRIG